MSIRPVDFNGMIQRTDDVSMLKHQEDAKPLVDQQNIQTQVDKNQEALTHQVVNPDQSTNAKNDSDAKDETKGFYYDTKGIKRKKKDAMVKPKHQSGSFDIKI